MGIHILRIIIIEKNVNKIWCSLSCLGHITFTTLTIHYDQHFTTGQRRKIELYPRRMTHIYGKCFPLFVFVYVVDAICLKKKSLLAENEGVITNNRVKCTRGKKFYFPGANYDTCLCLFGDDLILLLLIIQADTTMGHIFTLWVVGGSDMVPLSITINNTTDY